MSRIPTDLKHFEASDDDADLYASILKTLGFVILAICGGLGLLAVAAFALVLA